MKREEVVDKEELIFQLKKIVKLHRKYEHPEREEQDAFLVGWYRCGQNDILSALEKLIVESEE